MQTRRAIAAAMAMICVTLFLSCAKSQTQTTKEQQPAEPEAMAVLTTTSTATVQSLDAAQRTVTLQWPDGTTQTFKASPDVINFDQVQPGDQVNATVVDELAVFVRKASSPPDVTETQMVALAPKGAKPGIITTDTTQLTAKIQAIDTKARTVTLLGPAGNQRTFKVGPTVDLGALSVGDDVVARYTQALAVLVAKPQNGNQAMPTTQKL